MPNEPSDEIDFSSIQLEPGEQITDSFSAFTINGHQYDIVEISTYQYKPSPNGPKPSRVSVRYALASSGAPVHLLDDGSYELTENGVKIKVTRPA